MKRLLLRLALLAPVAAFAQAQESEPAGLTVRDNFQPYDITARNSADIAKALREHGVIAATESDYRSGYVWQLSWQLTPQEDARGCHVADVSVTLTSITNVPRWTAPAKAPPALSADWAKFSTALRDHLARQRNLAVTKAQQLRPRVAKLQAQSCETLQRGVDFLGHQWVEDMHKAEEDFARATRHGEADGVTWPPPVAAPRR